MRPSDVLPILGAVLVTISLTTRTASAETIHDGGQVLGNGSARVYMEFEADGKLRSLGVSFEEAMLEGLPSVPNTYSRCFDKNGNGRIDARGECNGDYELIFLLPDELTSRTDAPFRWNGVNWNPAGHPHPAPPPWAVPHFDFHFYIQEREAVRAIRAGKCSELIDCGDFERAQKPVPAKYRHRDHIDVGAAVPDMGNHLIDSKSPELAKNGPPFTHTFIFGATETLQERLVHVCGKKKIKL